MKIPVNESGIFQYLHIVSKLTQPAVMYPLIAGPFERLLLRERSLKFSASAAEIDLKQTK
jgi:hypothetical protein